ncbi:MAG TPA: TlpA family protein disulfide reductase, partial [Chryseobacterium indologenes]|nr:TlpA family protein disulfide reductase [Chryseobacterium indologenes]
NIIIDGEGTIMAKNIHGKDLQDFLKKNLNRN